MTSDELEQRIRDAGHAVTLAGEVDDETAAAVLGIARSTLRNHRAAGTSPPWSQRHGRCWYAVADLHACIVGARCVPDALDPTLLPGEPPADDLPAMTRITLTLPDSIIAALAEIDERPVGEHVEDALRAYEPLRAIFEREASAPIEGTES